MLIEGATVDLRLENQRPQAQTQELRGSRARLVAAGDGARRRLERDLHDGAQGRFAAVALHLRLAQRDAPPDSLLAHTLANAVKHAGAGLVAVDAGADRGRLVIDVTDDGRGGAAPYGGSGLDGLADRVGALDDHVAIDSPPGAGTRLHVEIPLVATPCRRFVRGG